MIKLSNENFGELISKGLWLVDFYADWCGPCKLLVPILEELDGDIDIIKVNIDTFPDLAKSMKIMSIPTIVYFRDGQILKTEVGFRSKEDIIKDLAEFK